MKKMKLKDIYKDINNGTIKAELPTSLGNYKILAVNPSNWSVITYNNSKTFTRTFYCTPDTIVEVK